MVYSFPGWYNHYHLFNNTVLVDKDGEVRVTMNLGLLLSESAILTIVLYAS